MPLRLNVGASRKVTDNHYGSRGASVNLELELDGSPITEPVKLQEKIRQLFGLVRTSLAEELNGSNRHSAPSPAALHQPNATENGSGRSPSRRPSGPRPATPSQVKAIHAIARSQPIELAEFLQDRFQVRRPDELSLKEASQIIDELKAQA
jgi:hypothetical protein